MKTEAYKIWLKSLKPDDKIVAIRASNNHAHKYNVVVVTSVDEFSIYASLNGVRLYFNLNTGNDGVSGISAAPLDAAMQMALDDQAKRIEVHQALSQLRVWDLSYQQVSEIAKSLGL